MSPNDLVHITGWKDFKVRKVELMHDPYKIYNKQLDVNEVIKTVFPDSEKQVLRKEKLVIQSGLKLEIERIDELEMCVVGYFTMREYP